VWALGPLGSLAEVGTPATARLMEARETFKKFWCSYDAKMLPLGNEWRLSCPRSLRVTGASGDGANVD